MDTLYTVRQKRIEMDFLRDSFTIYFFGDVHRDTRSCDVERWKWFLSRAKKDKGAWFVGMGDYHDFASAKEKKVIQSGALHETTINKFDEIAERDNRAFAAECSFMNGHLIGLIGGNHGWNFANGKTSDEDLAERLQTEYLGWLCHYTLIFQNTKKDRGAGTKAVHLVLCHGKSGGKTFGVTINQVGDLKSIFPAADIFCMGHDHQRGAWPVSVLLPVRSNHEFEIKQKRQFLCRSGSFKKAYCEDQSGYEVSRLFKPADLGALKLNISFHRNRKDGADEYITDIVAEI